LHKDHFIARLEKTAFTVIWPSEIRSIIYEYMQNYNVSQQGDKKEQAIEVPKLVKEMPPL